MFLGGKAAKEIEKVLFQTILLKEKSMTCC